jgi:hypothetical protein
MGDVSYPSYSQGSFDIVNNSEDMELIACLVTADIDQYYQNGSEENTLDLVRFDTEVDSDFTGRFLFITGIINDPDTPITVYFRYYPTENTPKEEFNFAIKVFGIARTKR